MQAAFPARAVLLDTFFSTPSPLSCRLRRPSRGSSRDAPRGGQGSLGTLAGQLEPGRPGARKALPCPVAGGAEGRTVCSWHSPGKPLLVPWLLEPRGGSIPEHAVALLSAGCPPCWQPLAPAWQSCLLHLPLGKETTVQDTTDCGGRPCAAVSASGKCTAHGGCWAAQ